MKIQIRRNVFETNSSSVHSITMCSKDDFEKWKNNSDFYMYHRYNKPDVVGMKEEIIELLKSEMAYLDKDWNNEDFVADLFADNEIFTFDRCFNKSDFETFVEYYTTPKGEDVVAFGFMVMTVNI